jgi:cytochrome c biogenesis protein CcdA
MNKSLGFSVLRATVKRRDQWSMLLARVARALIIVTCLGAWALVVVSIYNDGRSFALIIIAVIATLIGIPIYVIANASLLAHRCR